MLKCLDCNHEWLPRMLDGKKPLKCPSCFSTTWMIGKPSVAEPFDQGTMASEAEPEVVE